MIPHFSLIVEGSGLAHYMRTLEAIILSNVQLIASSLVHKISPTVVMELHRIEVQEIASDK
jgi:hypothetical protein